MAQEKVAVIGGGLGGLAAAIHLQSKGFQADLYEKNSSLGGKAGQISSEGFRFDTGPSLLTMPFVLKELFDAAGESLEEFIRLKKLDVLCKYFYPDSTIINAFADTDKLASAIEKSTTDSAKQVKEYLNYCKRIYDLSAELFLFKSFTDPKTFFSFKALRTLFNIKQLDTNRTMHDANSRFFNDVKTIQLFDRYATYNGSNPYEAPATLNIIQHVEYNLGGYICTDGIFAIPSALEKLALKKGVGIYKNTNVEKIIHKQNNITGIEVNGETLSYKYVVSNSDVLNTYKYLLKDEKTKSAKKYTKLEKSTSALVFYWGVEGLNDQLEIHNILFSENYKNEFEQLFNDQKIPDDPTIYIYISSKFNAADAPDNCENWFVMINTPYSEKQNWDDEVDKMREVILKKINKILHIDLKKNIRSENILTPKMIEQKTSSIGGSIYGISSNNKMSAFLRQQNRSKDYKGLYFCGGSAHPGGGIPLVLLSGKLAAEEILKDQE